MYVYKTPPQSFSDEKYRDDVERYHDLRLQFGAFLGRTAASMGPSEAARLAGVTVKMARYWRDKVLDPTFHPGSWGGHRDSGMAFGSLPNDVAVQMVVFMAICEMPDTSFRNLLAVLRLIPGLQHMSASWLSRTIQSWGWEWGRVRLIARNKYSPQNIDAWVRYAVGILDIPLNKVDSCCCVLVFLCVLMFLIFLKNSLCSWMSPSLIRQSLGGGGRWDQEELSTLLSTADLMRPAST